MNKRKRRSQEADLFYENKTKHRREAKRQTNEQNFKG